MTKRTTKEEAAKAGAAANLAETLARKPAFQEALLWIVGETPLIVHSWSEKAKKEMLSKQVKSTKAGKDARKPEEDFKESLYTISDGVYGFPATGIKNCILSAAHKDKGIAKTEVMSALWIHADMVRITPALAGAICDMPLVRIYGSEPQMREDMVKVGKGLNKTASLSYRGQFTNWAIRFRLRYNLSVLAAEAVATLIGDAGRSYGIGEWRNERKGMFGMFHLADAYEDKAWTDYAAGKGKLPIWVAPKDAG